jgi:hypothetical protein
VCNLYSLTKGQQAIRELSRAMSDRTGNLPILPGIFPDYRAPIVRNGLMAASSQWRARACRRPCTRSREGKQIPV